MMSLAFWRLASVALAALITTAAQAQVEASFPNRAIRVTVGFATGGGVDLIARLIGQKLSESFKQPVLVENRLGAAGMIAAETVAKAKPDGYTMLYTPSSVMTVNPVIFKQVRYSATRDFVAISTATTYPLFLIVNSSEPIQSVKQLVDYVKANPQKANYGGASGLFQLALELFKLKTGTQIELIPYKGTSEAVQAVMTGNVLMAIVSPESAIGSLKSGKVRTLALTSPTRVPAYPDIPTMAEAGFPELEIAGWQAFFAPARTPTGIVRALQEEINRILRLPDVLERINALQTTAKGSTSEELARKVAFDLDRWSAVAKFGNIKPE